jgi:transcription elongation GreA/GreB family factor
MGLTSDSNIVRIGSRVRVQDTYGIIEFYIVEPTNADATAERVSAKSPLGHAVLGRRVGELVRFRGPDAELAVTVMQIL